MAINVPAIALARSVVAPDNREVLWEDTSNMNLPFYERVKSYDSNSGQWRMVTQLPLELLNELRKVDGDGSGLDANFLQGRTVNDIIQLAKDGSFTLPNGFIFIGNTLGNAVARAVSGDATLNNIGTLSLIASGVTAGTYDLASLTIDAKGRITSASSYTITVNDIPELPQSKITNLTTDLSARELLANKENSVINTSTTKYPTVNLLKIGLDTKEPTITAGTTGQYWRGDKTFQTLDKTAVGLSNVDNTSDLDKPISTATQTELDLITDINWLGDYNNGYTYAVGDGVMFNGASFRMIAFIGAAGYNPSAYPANWLQITEYYNIIQDTTPQLGGDLDLNNNDINGTGNVDITGNVIADIVQLKGGVGTQGEMSWSVDEETVQLVMDGTTLHIGQDTFVHARNNTDSIITKGTAVYATGTLGASGRITVAPMIANGTIPGRLFIGLAAENIAIGADGQVMTFGKIRQINTNAYTDGDVLWLSPTVAGQLTTTEPTAPNLKIATAFVIHAATNGTLMVRAEQGTDLHSDQRVQVSGLTNGDVLTWSNANQRWENEQPVDTNFANTDLTLTGNRTHELSGNTLNFSNSATNFLRLNTFNEIFTFGKGDTTNLYFGNNVLRNVTSGLQNVIVGNDINGITTGQVNTFVGFRAGQNLNNSGNSFFGGFAGYTLTSGANNVIIGRSAAFSTNAGGTVSNLENSIVIGETARVLNSGDVNTIVIGRNSRGLGSNTVVIGNSDITRTQLRGRVEMDTTTDGILLPRLTTAQMNAIASPATNLLVFNTDLNGLYRYTGSAWVALSAGYGIIEVKDSSGYPTFYADLQTALNATGDIDTVYIYSDIQVTAQISIPNRTSLTIEMNGHSIWYNTTSGDFNLFRFATSGGAGTDRVFIINGGGTLEQVGTVVSSTNAAVIHFFQASTQRQLQIFAGTTLIKSENAFTIYNQANLRLIDGGIWYSTNKTISLNTASAIIRNANIDIYTGTDQFSGTYDNCHLNTRYGYFWIGGSIINSRITGAILQTGTNIGMIMCSGNDTIANNIIENGTGAVNWAINCYYAGSSGRISNNTINSTHSGINLRYGSAFNNYVYAGSSRAITKTSLGNGVAFGNTLITNATNVEAIYTTGGIGVINNYCLCLNASNTTSAIRSDGANEQIIGNTAIVNNAAVANINLAGNVYLTGNVLSATGTGITGAGVNLMTNTMDAFGNIKIG